MDTTKSTTRILFAVQPYVDIMGLCARMKTPLSDEYDICKSIEDYNSLTDKYSYDLMVVLYGGFVLDILNDQAKNSQRLKWVHSVSAGIDAYVSAADFRASPIPLTNVKGAFSAVLGEFIGLGMLYHTKKLESFA